MSMDDKKHIVAVTAFIKNKEGDKFLVVKRNKNEIAYPGLWSFPGGKVEKKETVFQALQREVAEEVGLEIEEHKKFIKDYTFVRPDGHNVVGFCFEVVAKSENVRLSPEFEDWKWITPGELVSLRHIDGMEEEVMIVFES